MIDAGEALRLYLVSAVVAPDRVVEEAVALAASPRDVLLRTKAKIVRRARVVEGTTLDL